MTGGAPCLGLGHASKRLDGALLMKERCSVLLLQLPAPLTLLTLDALSLSLW